MRAKHERELEAIIREEDQTLIGWRTVPTNDEKLGQSAIAAKPFVRQVFIGKNASLQDELAFERKIYVIRKRAELAIRYSGAEGADSFYFSSLSSKKIVYKGMLTTEQVRSFYAGA